MRKGEYKSDLYDTNSMLYAVTTQRICVPIGWQAGVHPGNILSVYWLKKILCLRCFLLEMLL